MIFKKNIEILGSTQPELAGIILGVSDTDGPEIVQTRSGQPSIKVSGKSLHSKYDPAKEGKGWVEHYKGEIDSASSIYVFGFGLAYHIKELCRITDRPITIFEPSIEILKAAFSIVDLTAIIPKIRIETECRMNASEDKLSILEHRPSVLLNNEYFEKIRSGLQAKNLTRGLKAKECFERGLRIVVVGPVFGGSLPVAKSCAYALKKIGHKVEFIDNSRFDDALHFARDIANNEHQYDRMVNYLLAYISETVIPRIENFKPDLIMALAQSPLTTDCLEWIRKQNIPTAYWFVEDFRVMSYWKKIARFYDYFFTIQKGDFFSELEKAGIMNCHYLPMAASPDIHKPVDLNEDQKGSYGSDISFMGAGYYNRRHFLKGLLDFDFKIWGSDWDMNSDLAASVQRSGARIDTDETVKIFNATKININLHSSTYHKGINPFGDFVNPRAFEIASCCGFQLVDRRSGLEGLFEEGKEIVIFNDLEDLRKKIKHYLDHPDERSEIAQRGRKRVLKDHTYEKRMEEMLDFILNHGFEPARWEPEEEDVQSLVNEAGQDTELGKYLARFHEKGMITLDDIVKDINEGEGKISKTESLFLIMSKFAGK